MALTDAQFQYLMHNDPEFNARVAIYGRPKNVRYCGDPDANPGDICLQGACVNGIQKIMFCDRTNGCTIERNVPC
jgi:hypothetical protein